MKLVEKVRELADKKACTPGQLALAWVHSKGDDIFPIPGKCSCWSGCYMLADSLLLQPQVCSWQHPASDVTAHLLANLTHCPCLCSQGQRGSSTWRRMQQPST